MCFVATVICTDSIICFPMGRPLGYTGGMVQFWYFFFPQRGGELSSFGNHFAGPWEHTRRI